MTATTLNGIIVDGKVYTAEMGHPDYISLCTKCDLSDYCEHTDREVCASISLPTDHFRFNQQLTLKLNQQTKATADGHP